MKKIGINDDLDLRIIPIKINELIDHVEELESKARKEHPLPSMEELLDRAYQKGVEYAADKMLREYKLLPMTFSVDECDKLMEYVAKQLKGGKVMAYSGENMMEDIQLRVPLIDIRNKVREDAIDECIRITNECCWKDAKMLVELFEQMKEKKHE